MNLTINTELVNSYALRALHHAYSVKLQEVSYAAKHAILPEKRCEMRKLEGEITTLLSNINAAIFAKEERA